MDMLAAVREAGLPDSLTGGGVISMLVWDRLHGERGHTRLRDGDVAFFDPEDLSADRDRRATAALRFLRPAVPWQVKNRTAVHLWYGRRFGFPVEPFLFGADGIATWPETAISIAIRLEADGALSRSSPLRAWGPPGHVLASQSPRGDRSQVRVRETAPPQSIPEIWPKVRVIRT